MSAFGGKADMTFCGNPLSRSLLGVKRTCLFALHMSANDPKRTSVVPLRLPVAVTLFSRNADLLLHFKRLRISQNPERYSCAPFCLVCWRLLVSQSPRLLFPRPHKCLLIPPLGA